MTAHQGDFLADILGTFQKHETPPTRQIVIDRTDSPTKNAIDRDAQGGSLSIHCAAAADHQIRMPDQINAVDDLLRNAHGTACKKLQPARPDLSCLALVARQHDKFDVRAGAEEPDRLVE